MFASVRRYEGVTDPPEVGKRVQDGFVPLLKETPGFVAYYWVDAGGGDMVSTSVFEDMEGAKASDEKAAAWVKENVAEMMPNPPVITEGEVVATSA